VQRFIRFIVDQGIENGNMVIAHRLSTTRKAAVLSVVSGGRIVERGRHEELLARIGVYRELHGRQFVWDSNTAELSEPR
jgi:ABC-type transport system involved in Fe-S cluster assembly fused permease/ATPase subunit